jgi:hypothetical protein
MHVMLMVSYFKYSIIAVVAPVVPVRVATKEASVALHAAWLSAAPYLIQAQAEVGKQSASVVLVLQAVCSSVFQPDPRVGSLALE